MSERVAVVTGASAGIGAATARRLAAAGYRVIAAARRLDRLEELAAEIGGEARRLDVTDPASVAELVAGIERLDLLVNNAGGALGLDPIEHSDDDRWRIMWETNVLGLMRMTRALLPALRAAGTGHVINVGSVAGFEIYTGGAGYTSVKHAARAVTRTLRLELLGEPIRITEINPGPGRDRVRPGAVRRRRGARRLHLHGHDAAHRRRRRRRASSGPPADRRTSISTRSSCGRATRPRSRISTGAQSSLPEHPHPSRAGRLRGPRRLRRAQEESSAGASPVARKRAMARAKSGRA